MRFWDSSAVVPLIVEEPVTRPVQARLLEDAAMVVWWGTRVECASALARLERERRLSASGWREAERRTEAMAADWSEVVPSERLRELALRLLRVHSLRAADALQLGAALVFADRDPKAIAFVTLDDRLAAAAAREGFEVLGGLG